MLRELKLNDAEKMLEWMHDEEVIIGLQANVFRDKTVDDCLKFIESSWNDSKNRHMAIVDENDNYMGTVSLKNISSDHKDAEFAIVLRRDAQGHGYASHAMKEILTIAFDELGLNEVYWNVLNNNSKAIKLYEKGGYKKLTVVNDRFLEHAPKVSGSTSHLSFFHVTKEDYK